MDFPAELQLELMEEDMAHDEVCPDEEQLEVLEDIWLKAGEIGEFFTTTLNSLISYNFHTL